MVHDARSKVATQVAGELGCEATRSLAKVNEQADIVFTAVDDDDAMDEVFDPLSRSLLSGAAGHLYINCATLSPRMQIDIEGRLIEAEAQCVEACISRTPAPSGQQCELVFLCAGEPPAFERARPILEKLGKRVRFVGKAGTAASLKAVISLVTNINTAGLAEGLALGDALGIDPILLREVLAQTCAASRVLETDGEGMQNRQHPCRLSAAHAAKDAGIALRLSREQRLQLPLATATKRQFSRMVKYGFGELDKSAVAELAFRDRGTTRR